MPSQEFLHRRGSVWERYDFFGKPFEQARADMEVMAIEGVTVYDDVAWEPGSAGEISGKWVRPAKPAGGLLYYIHGGGFTHGSSGIPLPFLMEMSHRTGLVCFSADYRLAPEYTFPAAPEDALAGYKALLDMGFRPEQTIICGESAGATLSLDVALMAKRSGLPAPAGIVAMSPVTNAAVPAEGVVLEGLNDADGVMDVYAPGVDRTDPLLSPALGDLEGFPPVFLSVGGTEILLKDSLFFTEQAARAGADVRLHVGRDMIHTYPLDLWDYPEAMEAFGEIELFIRQRLSK